MTFYIVVTFEDEGVVGHSIEADGWADALDKARAKYGRGCRIKVTR
jgi:hypothetical protein